jgi:hypothetical protein
MASEWFYTRDGQSKAGPVSSAWPMSHDYNEAIQSPDTSFSDAELRQGQATTNALGIPMPYSGNFADVYEFSCPANKWAIKCFTRDIAGLKERYREVSAYLKQTNLPFMVDFTYLEQGIRVRGQWFPILKMRWVEGFTLNEFVRNNLETPQLLDVLSQLWVKLAATLREAQMAHCDLQHGNVLLVPGSKAASLEVKLVDYDGMCVPALTLLKSIEVGHPNFQHPARAKKGIYSVEVDRFPNLVICTALRALMVGGRALWDKYDNGDNLLFRQADFEAPTRSVLIAELLRLNDPVVRRLTENLVDACKRPLDHTPLLEGLILTPHRRGSPAQPNPAPKAQPAPSVFARTTPIAKRPKQKSKAPLLVLGVAAALGLVTGLIGGLFLMSGDKQDEETPKVAEKPRLARVSEQKGSPLKAKPTDQFTFERQKEEAKERLLQAELARKKREEEIREKERNAQAAKEREILAKQKREQEAREVKEREERLEQEKAERLRARKQKEEDELRAKKQKEEDDRLAQEAKERARKKREEEDRLERAARQREEEARLKIEALEEVRAGVDLKKVRELIEQEKLEQAEEACEKLVKAYPRTKAATQALNLCAKIPDAIKARDNEKAATASLKLIKRLIEPSETSGGKREGFLYKAKTRLERFVKRYPATKSAAEARKLLKEVEEMLKKYSN